MKISNTHLVLLFLLTIFISCETDEEKIAQAEKECTSQTKIDGFSVSFYGYFLEDADSINIKIRRNGKFILDYNDIIPQRISDSLRHQRNYFVKNEILLTDTVFIKIKGEAAKAISDFKYSVRAHFTMMSRNWGCDFHELKVDGIVNEGATVMFTHKNWNWEFINRNNLKDYYSKKELFKSIDNQ